MPFEDQICTEHRQVKNGLPYLCFHTSTQTLHVSRLPGDQRTRSHPPKPRRFLRSASRHSTLIYIAWPAALEQKRGVALKNGLPYLDIASSYLDIALYCIIEGDHFRWEPRLFPPGSNLKINSMTVFTQLTGLVVSNDFVSLCCCQTDRGHDVEAMFHFPSHPSINSIRNSLLKYECCS